MRRVPRAHGRREQLRIGRAWMPVDRLLRVGLPRRVKGPQEQQDHFGLVGRLRNGLRSHHTAHRARADPETRRRLRARRDFRQVARDLRVDDRQLLSHDPIVGVRVCNQVALQRSRRASERRRVGRDPRRPRRPLRVGRPVGDHALETRAAHLPRAIRRARRDAEGGQQVLDERDRRGDGRDHRRAHARQRERARDQRHQLVHRGDLTAQDRLPGLYERVCHRGREVCVAADRRGELLL